MQPNNPTCPPNVQWQDENGKSSDYRQGVNHTIGALQCINSTLQLRPSLVLDHQSELASLLFVPQHSS